MMNYDNKEAKAFLDKAINSLEENLDKIEPQEIKTIETYLNKHLGILQHLLLLTEENRTNLAIDNLNFRNILPFYLFDLVDKLVSLTSKNQELLRQSKKEIADKSPKPKESIQNDSERNIRQSSFGDPPDEHYSPNDLQSFRDTPFISNSFRKYEWESRRSNRQEKNYGSQTLMEPNRNTEEYRIDHGEFRLFKEDEQDFTRGFRIPTDLISVNNYGEEFLPENSNDRINSQKAEKYSLQTSSYIPLA